MPMDHLPPLQPPTPATYEDTRDAIVNVRARVRDGKLISLVDQQGNNLGMPVTARVAAGSPLLDLYVENDKVSRQIDSNGARPVGYPISASAFGDSLAGFGGGFLTFTDLESGGRIRKTGIASFPGWTTTQLKDAVASIESFGAAQNVCVMACANDALTGVGILTTLSNLRYIYQQIRAKGHSPLALSPPPQGDQSKRQAVKEIVAGIKSLASELDLDYIPVFELLVDPTTGGWLPGFDSGDGTHFSPPAIQVVGRAVRDVLILKSPSVALPIQASSVQGANLFPQALGLADSDGDGDADGWTTYLSASGANWSLIDDSTIPGRWMTCIVSGANGEGRLACRRSGGFSEKMRYTVALRLHSSGLAGTTSKFWIRLIWYINSGGTTVRVDTLLGGVMQAIPDGVMVREVEAPIGATEVEIEVRVGPGDGVYAIAQPTLTPTN